MKYYITSTKDDELIHYGILGMKWGVRRTPEQLGHHVLKKGTTVRRTVADKNESTTGNKYVTYTQEDRDLYTGGYLNDLKRWNGLEAKDPMYEKTYQLKEDLNIPSRDEVTNVINQLKTDSSSKKDFAKAESEAYTGWYKTMYASRIPELQVDYLIEKIQSEGRSVSDLTEDDWNDADNYINDLMKKTYKNEKKNWSDTQEYAFIADTFGMPEGQQIKEMIVSELSDRGYNAMSDQASIGGIANRSVQGLDPLIVFNGEKSLEEVKTKKIGSLQSSAAYKRGINWLTSAQRDVDWGKVQW
jgi:hypothetical protein